jgi:hypothetical protein
MVASMLFADAPEATSAVSFAMTEGEGRGSSSSSNADRAIDATKRGIDRRTVEERGDNCRRDAR